MAKSILIPLCLCICQFLHAQDYKTADATIPQKLELRKANIAWVDHPAYFDSPNANAPGYFFKRSEETDTGQSILYLGPPKQDSFDLNLPKIQVSHVNFRASAKRQQPLFSIQQ
jgi:hypothetical protein